ALVATEHGRGLVPGGVPRDGAVPVGGPALDALQRLAAARGPAGEIRLGGRLRIALLDQVHRCIARLLERIATPIGERLVVLAERAVERAARAALVAGVAGE